MCDMMMMAIAVDSSRLPDGDSGKALSEIQSMITRAGLGVYAGPPWAENQFSSGGLPKRGVLGRLTRRQLPEPMNAIEYQRRVEHSRRYRTILSERLESMIGGPSAHGRLFELTSGPGAPCICNATWNNSAPPVPHPENAPIVGALAKVLRLPYLCAVAVFYGPSGVEEPERAREWEETSEPAGRFLQHFYLEGYGEAIGNGIAGFFRLQLREF